MGARVLIVILLGCWLLPAMDAGAAETRFGLMGGLNRAETSLENPPSDADRSALLRYGGGMVLSVQLSPTIAIDADVLYLQKGARSEAVIDQGGYSYGSEGELRLGYAVVSPMLKIGGQGSSLSPYFIAGPEFGYLVQGSGWERSWTGSPNQKHEREYDLEDYLETTSWGWSIGAGLEIPTSGMSAFVEGRYAAGLTNIWKPENTGAWGEEKPKGIYALGGIRF